MIIFTCGGTGGHITPAIDIAKKIKTPHHFIGGNRLEKKMLKNYSFSEISTSRKNVFNILNGIFETIKIIKHKKPKAVFSTGGYVTLPVGIAAFLTRTPLILLEQNSIPGKTNLLLAKVAKLIFTGYPKTNKYFPKTKTIYSGNPVAESTTEVKKKKKLLVAGGSQGANQLNEIFLNTLPLLPIR